MTNFSRFQLFKNQKVINNKVKSHQKQSKNFLNNQKYVLISFFFTKLSLRQSELLFYKHFIVHSFQIKNSNLSGADGDAGVGQFDVGVGTRLHQQHVGALYVAMAITMFLQVGARVGQLPHNCEVPLLCELLQIVVLLVADAEEGGDAADSNVLQHHHVSVEGNFFSSCFGVLVSMKQIY